MIGFEDQNKLNCFRTLPFADYYHKYYVVTDYKSDPPTCRIANPTGHKTMARSLSDCKSKIRQQRSDFCYLKADSIADALRTYFLCRSILHQRVQQIRLLSVEYHVDAVLACDVLNLSATEIEC